MEKVIEIEPTERDGIDALPVKYNITDAAINQLRVQYTGLEITDKSSYKAVISAIADVRGRRTSVEKRRKELKAGALDYGRRVDGEAKRITGLLEEIEEPLKEKKLTEDSKETKRIAFIQSRIEEIRAMVPTVPTSSDTLSEVLFDLDTMVIGEDFQEFQEQAEAVRFETAGKINQMITYQHQCEKTERECREEEQRLEVQKREQETREIELAHYEALIENRERKIVAKEAEIEAEKLEKQERIKTIETQRYNGLLSVGYQYPEIDLGIITEAEYQELYQGFKAIWDKEQEQIRIEAEDNAAKEKAEFEKAATEKAEREAKERQEREEAERKAIAEVEATEAKRQEALKPDKEKLLAFAGLVDELYVKTPNLLEFRSENAVYIINGIRNRIDELSEYVRTEARKLSTAY